MKETMKAQVFYRPGEMRLEERPMPIPADDEVLVRVRACGVCGSDINYYFGKAAVETESGEGPTVLGHEFAGEIAGMGSAAAASGLFALGERVLGVPVQQCNVCEQCAEGNHNLCENKVTSGVSADGGFAEYTVIRYTHVMKIPDGVSFEEASMCEPLACACYGIKKLDVRLGDFTVIIGPGSIGLMQLQLARALGASPILVAGVLDYGLEKAKSLGADYVFNTADKASPYYTADLAASVSELTGGKMANRVIIATGAKSALQSGLTISGKKSVVVFFGMPGDDMVLEVPLLDTMMNDKTLHVSWQAPGTFPMAQKAMAAGKVELSGLITHTFPLERLEEALLLMNDPKVADKLKTIIQI